MDDLIIDGFTLTHFTSYLEGTLIPDLEAAGMDATAEDFETALKFIKALSNDNN